MIKTLLAMRILRFSRNFENMLQLMDSWDSPF